jgi:hypothetical protein
MNQPPDGNLERKQEKMDPVKFVETYITARNLGVSKEQFRSMVALAWTYPDPDSFQGDALNRLRAMLPSELLVANNIDAALKEIAGYVLLPSNVKGDQAETKYSDLSSSLETTSGHLVGSNVDFNAGDRVHIGRLEQPDAQTNIQLDELKGYEKSGISRRCLMIENAGGSIFISNESSSISIFINDKELKPKKPVQEKNLNEGDGSQGAQVGNVVNTTSESPLTTENDQVNRIEVDIPLKFGVPLVAEFTIRISSDPTYTYRATALRVIKFDKETSAPIITNRFSLRISTAN